MPLHFPGVGHHSHQHRRSGSLSDPKKPQFPPAPPLGAPPGHTVPHESSTSSSSTLSSPPPGILRKVDTQSSASGSDYQSSTSASAFATKKLSLLSMDRTDTIESYGNSDDERGYLSGASTPATSVSSGSNQCPLPPSSAAHKFPFFMMTLSSTSTISFAVLPLDMRSVILDAIQRAWPKGISKQVEVDYLPEAIKRRHKQSGLVCEGGIWEVSMKGDCWNPLSQDKVSSKRILINLMTEFAREGYSLTSSYRTSAKDSGKDSLMFLRGTPDPDPIFFAVAFHSSDRVWIVDADAEAGEHLEKAFREFWYDGIAGIRTRERHCREIRLKGNPWTAHSVNALISARCIHMFVMKTTTHCDRGYDFVGSVDMEDREESGIATLFFRKAWGASRARWHLEGGVSNE